MSPSSHVQANLPAVGVAAFTSLLLAFGFFSPSCTLVDSVFLRLTIGLRFSTRWMPTMPRKAPKLSCEHKDPRMTLGKVKTVT